MSYDTLHRWYMYLLNIEQTKIFFYNLPDTTANFEKKKLLQKQIFYSICTIMTIPAYSKWYPKRRFLTLNVLAIVIIIFIEFDDLTSFKKIFMIIYLYIKWGSLIKTYHIRNTGPIG